MTAEVRVGTSGWQYSGWREVVYPEGLATSRWLSYYAEHFPTVEVNATSYRLAREATVQRWRAAVPPRFEFSVKGSQFITHRLKLTRPSRALERFFAPLGPVLDGDGVILWQLPRSWRRNAERLHAFLEQLPTSHRYAVEFRDDDWFHPTIYDVLTRHEVALVWLSSSLTERHENVQTADHVYVRFHGLSVDPYRYRYSKKELEPWGACLGDLAQSGTPAWVYFNNDHAGHAVRNASMLIDLLGQSARPWPPRSEPAEQH